MEPRRRGDESGKIAAGEGVREPRLDGLRAIAVLAVIVTHTTTQTWGWAGVDLFFVLSGYLITGILRRERGELNYWSRFYIKRAARILPALTICLLFNALLFPEEWAHSWAYCIFFLGNIPFILRESTPQSMGVLWSLAVEEHYYLLWPFAVRNLERKWLIRILIALLCIEPLLRWSVHMPTNRLVYAFTPLRLDGIALGSLLALLMESAAGVLRRWSAPMAALVGVIILAIKLADPYFYRMANASLFNSIGYSLITLMLGGITAYVITHERGVVNWLLSLPPLAWVGRISYGIYLYHAFFLAFAFKHFRVGKPAFAADTALAICVSAASFYLYESPILRTGWSRTSN